MKWITLLLLGVIVAGGVALDCNATQKVDLNLIAVQLNIGASSVPTLSLRNTVAAAEKFKESLINARTEYGLVVGRTDYDQIVGIGRGLIEAIECAWAKLEESIKETPILFTRSNRITKDVKQINKQLDIILALEPGNQKVEVELNEMPSEPKFKSNNKNLTASDAFLHFAKIKDDELAAKTYYAGAIYWHGWKASRKILRDLQNQYRNEVLNNQVLPAYRKVVDDVYASDIQSCVDESTWGLFIGARKSICKLSDAYIKSLATGEKCY